MTLPGYSLGEQIFLGRSSRIVRSVRESDGLKVVLKFPVFDTLSLRDTLRFQNEYQLVTSLDLSRVIRIHALIPWVSGFVIVEEDFGALDLERFLDGRALSPTEFFPIALAMAEGLAQLHTNRVIHKDIHLGNILIEPKSGLVKLTDFGLSTLIEDESQEAMAPEMIEGTLYSISPEQTGRMNHPVDNRSDLYSLGVCFYRILTGQLPFTATDPMEMVHAHIARHPVAPHLLTPTLPRALSDLVMKLLAKEPRERYQSAQGVMADLETLRTHLRFGTLNAGFALGSQDISLRFQVTRKIYGRDREVQILLDAFERVAGGRTELLLISGYSGVGKTALVQEIHRSLARQRGRFLSGKHDQYQRDIPFSALIQSFRELINQILAESEEQVAHWRQTLTDTLGHNARIIVDLLPEAGILLGDQPAVPELGAVETKNRFFMTIQKFIGVFARPEHPLVIFLDDLQWADTPSLQLMRVICSNAEGMSLLLLGAYRDNEVPASHPLMELLRQLAEEGAPLETIHLEPLGVDDTNRVVADTLHQPPETTRDLSALLQEKTGGNPFFLSQTLKELHTKHLFSQDASTGRWAWDLEQMRSLAMTDNVVDLMVRKLNRLPVPTQVALKYAACVGNRFTVDILAAIAEKSEADLGSDLWGALKEGLILPSGTGFKFLHDRVQQAADSLISDQERHSLHLKVGRLLIRHLAGDQLENALFDILGHFNQALDEVTDPAERTMLVRLNLRAGKRAMRATASTTALASFQAALGLLPTGSWDTDYELALELHTGAVTAAFLCGNYPLMDTYSQEVLSRARTFVDKVPVFKAKAEVCVSENRNLDAILTVLPVLRELGIRFPDDPGPDDINAALGKTMGRLAQRPAGTLIELPLMTDPQKLAAMEILVSISTSCYQSFPALFPLVVMEQVDLSLEYGNCEVSSFSYMAYAMILSGLLEDFESAYHFGQMAIDIARKLESKKIYGKLIFMFNNNIRHHKVPLSETLPDLTEGVAIAMDLGDPEYSCLARLAYLQHMLFLGEPLGRVRSEMAFSADVMRGVKQENALKFMNIHRQAVLNLTESRGSPWVLTGDAFDEAVPISANDITTFYCLYLCRGMLEYWFGQHEEAEKTMSAAMGTLAGAIGLAGVPIVYFYDCLSKLAVLPLRSEEEQKQLWVEIDSSLAKLKIRAKHCPANHQHKALLVEAERQRVLGGRSWEVLDLYEQAIRLAGQNGYLQEEAMANEKAGIFALALGNDTIGRAYLVQAHRAYLRWGATIKVRALEQTHLFLAQSERLPGSSDMSRDKLDLISVLKASEVISGEIHLDGLLKKIMGIVIENAGAEKGYLLLSGDGNWVVAAQANVRDGIPHLENSPLTGSSLVCEAIVRFVIRTRQDLFLEDAGRNSPFQTDPQVVSRGIRSVLCLPLVSQNRLSGVIYLENNLSVGAFSAKRSQVMKMLTAQASIAIENALLYQSLELKVAERTRSLEEANCKLKAMSDTDGLTGVANRRRFDEVLEAEWRRAARSGLSVGLILLDVDWFKKYNDQYGHQAGDACLQQVAEVLRSRTRRAGDLAARYGGEEFAFIAPETDRKALQAIAEEIRSTLEAQALPHDGSDFGKVTASLGIAALVPTDGQMPSQLILEADQALYRAKAEGRNRIAG